MALHDRLSIYRDARELMNLSALLVKNMSRGYKPILGRDIHEECLRTLLLIARANQARDKAPALTQVIDHMHTATELFRTAHDLREIGHRQWARTVELTQSIARQATGWRRSINKSNAALSAA